MISSAAAMALTVSIPRVGGTVNQDIVIVFLDCFKILAVPLFLIVGTVELLFKFLTNLSSYVIGPLMFFIIGWDIWFLFAQEWA